MINYCVTYRSYIGTWDIIELAFEDSVKIIYVSRCGAKSCTIIADIEFMLKYDDLNFYLLAVVRHKMEEQELLNYILIIQSLN
mgnify:CR=1 FL=1